MGTVLQKEEGNKQKEEVKIKSEWMLGGSLEREREENVNKIKIVWLWWEVGWRDKLAGTGEGIHDEPKRENFCFGFGLKLYV